VVKQGESAANILSLARILASRRFSHIWHNNVAHLLKFYFLKSFFRRGIDILDSYEFPFTKIMRQIEPRLDDTEKNLSVACAFESALKFCRESAVRIVGRIERRLFLHAP